VVGSTGAALAAVEGAFRVAHVGDPYDDTELRFGWRPRAPYAQDQDPAIGLRLARGFTGTMEYHRVVDGALVKSVPVRTNDLGLRGPEVTPEPALRRFLAVGDSVTFGQGVPEDHTWVTAATAALSADTPTEGVNAGVPTWNTVQEVRWFETVGLGLHPDLAVLAWFANDVEPPLGVVPGQFVADVPLETPTWAHAGPERVSFAWTWARRVLDRRAFAAEVLAGWGDYRERLRQLGRDPFVRSAQAGAMMRFAGACKAGGVRCLVVTIPLLQVADDPGSADLVAGALADARAVGLPTFDATAVVSAVPFEERVVYPSDPHPSEATHAALGVAIARALAALP